MSDRRELSRKLGSIAAAYYTDPLGFILYAFPWGQPGTFLAEYDGPDECQVEVFEAIRRSVEAGIEPIQIARASGHGVGKALADVEPVLTPGGWVPMGEIRHGDQVITADGSWTRVTGVYPQGKRLMYRVTLSDGGSVLADAEHQWLTETRSQRKHGKPGTVKTTAEIRDTLMSGVALNHRLPSLQAVHHPTMFYPIDPYLLGFWLGDGHAGRVSGSEDKIELLESTGVGVGNRQYDKRNGVITVKVGIRPELRALGLLDKRSWEKFIPRMYLHGSVKQRIALLQGLLDTDGTVGKDNGSVSFDSASEALADGVAELTRSLGGVAYRHQRQGRLNGVDKRVSYRVTVCLPEGIVPFRLQRKAALYSPDWGSGNCERTRRRYIRSVIPAGHHDATCIAVEHPSQLYVTRDHIVTHNTAMTAMIILWFIATRRNPQIVVTANTKEQLLNKTWRELAKWHGIFLFADLFEWQATTYKYRGQPSTWFAHAVPWSVANTQSFAGTHERHVLMLFDEASTIDDGVWEVASGAMTTPGAMWLAFGNPTLNTGYFRSLPRRELWQFGSINAEHSRFTNREYLRSLEKEEGRDSDYYKVRVLGEFPSVGAKQLISVRVLESAQNRHYDPYQLDGMPLYIGCDIGRGGDPSVIRFRRGPKLYEKRVEIRDDNLMRVAARIALIMRDGETLEDGLTHKPAAAIIDEAGVGGGVVDRLIDLGFRNVHGVQVGGASPEPIRYTNIRAYLWYKGRDWLETADIPKHDVLFYDDCISGVVDIDMRGRSKMLDKDVQKRTLGRSPDDADAVWLSLWGGLTSHEEDEEEYAPEAV